MFYYEGSKAMMRQFQRQTSSLDIRYVKEYPIPRVKHQGQRPFLIVISGNILLYLLDCGLGLLNCYSHSFCELIYHFQSRGSLPGFKAYTRGASSVEQE